MNSLYYGDNLTVLRNEIERESVDLLYLAPPFNSRQDYNVLFRSTSGERSQAQIEAFDDTWHWGDEAERAFDEVIRGWNADTSELLRSLRAFLKENDLMASGANSRLSFIPLGLTETFTPHPLPTDYGPGWE